MLQGVDLPGVGCRQVLRSEKVFYACPGKVLVGEEFLVQEGQLFAQFVLGGENGFDSTMEMRYYGFFAAIVVKVLEVYLQGMFQ